MSVMRLFSQRRVIALLLLASLLCEPAFAGMYQVDNYEGRVGRYPVLDLYTTAHTTFSTDATPLDSESKEHLRVLVQGIVVHRTLRAMS
jgi:hypothetical protein